MHTILFPVNKLQVGGAEQQLLELVRGLDKSRYRPIVAPLYPGGALDAEFRAVPGAEVVDLHRRGKYDPWTLVRVMRLLRARRVDIVQPFLSPATFFGLLPALLVGTPVKIVTERCGVRRYRGLGYTTYRVAEDFLTRFADAVVANSLAGRQLLLSRGIPASQVCVFYNGVNPERLQVDAANAAVQRARLNVPAGGKVVGILASLTPAKDHATFLRAAASARRPDVRFAIIGDGPLRQDLARLAAELGLGERVVFFGNQRRVADVLVSCDLLVSASRDNEGCSNSILEAMLLGVPVVATDLGGNGELIEPGATGYLVPVGDHARLAEAMEHVFAHPAEAQAVATRARQQAQARFSLERMVSDYEALYERLLRQARVGQSGRPTPRLAEP